MQIADRSSLRRFYATASYWMRHSVPRRPSEMHTPRFLRHQLESLPEEEISAEIADGVFTVQLADKAAADYKGVLLHESLFHYYKAWYNYLAARQLYIGGYLHWIDISLYYSRFYLAHALVTLAVGPIYKIAAGDSDFLASVAAGLRVPEGGAYRIRVALGDPIIVSIDRGRVGSHSELWQRYEGWPERMGLHDLIGARHALSRFGAKADYLSVERNEENYSFSGYAQLDFNLPIDSFRQFFERDSVKAAADTVYDWTSADVLLSLCEYYRLFQNLGVNGLPIELDKHEFMIRYCLGDSTAADHLIQLCIEGFSLEELYSHDGDQLYDAMGRVL